jgi:hypothetical protein
MSSLKQIEKVNWLYCYFIFPILQTGIKLKSVLHSPVEGVKKFGSFITFELSDRFNTKSDQPKNPFDVLVNTAVTLKYPKKFGWNPEESTNCIK